MAPARVLRPLLRVGPVALCALTAHAVLYRSFFPTAGSHGYFGWFEPLVGSLSAASALAGGAAALAAVLGKGTRFAAALRPATPGPASAARLAALGVAWLFAQETIEGSVAAGSLDPATFGATEWATLVGAAVLAAAALTALARLGVAAIVSFLPVPARRAIRWEHVACPAGEAPPRRRRALADRRGLRAPPRVA